MEVISCTIKEVATSAHIVKLHILTDCHLGKTTNMQWKHLTGTVFPEAASLTYWQLSQFLMAFNLGAVHWLTLLTRRGKE